MIYPKSEVKYLGVMIDCHMKWDIHINYLVKKVRSILYKLKYLPIKQPITLYHALVESLLRYGIVAWSGALKTHLEHLEIIQRRFFTRFNEDRRLQFFVNPWNI